MDPIGERISLIISRKNISVVELSRIVEQSDKSIYNYIAGKNTPTYPVLGKIVEKYPDVNARWLLTGEGEMWISGSELKGALRAQVAYNIGGDNTQLQVSEPAAPYDPCAALRTEVAYLRQQVADKEEIIALLKAAQQPK